MRKLLTQIMTVFLFGCLVSLYAEEELVKLPPVDKSRGGTVMQALQDRKSVREFSEKELSMQDISDLLWAANGLNRPDKHTNASGKNKQSIEIYLCMKSGAYRYDSREHALHRITSEDLRSAVADWQDFAAKAPVSLVVASNLSDPLYRDEEWKFLPAYDAGIVSENIYLFCSANGFGTICRTTMNREKLKAALKLTDKHVLHLNHPVGFSPGVVAATSPPLFPRGKKAEGEHYTGDIYISVPVQDEKFGLAYLDFEPGSHNDWHIHPDATQVMIVIDGAGFYQEEGQTVRLLKKGDIVVTPPNVKHWNGATPVKPLLHLTVTDHSSKGHIEWRGKISPGLYAEPAEKN